MKNKFLYICAIIPIKNQTKQMKKVFAIITGCAIVGLVACGPSAADKEKAQRMQDSLMQDSLMKVASQNATPPPADSSAAAPADSSAH